MLTKHALSVEHAGGLTTKSPTMPYYPTGTQIFVQTYYNVLVLDVSFLTLLS